MMMSARVGVIEIAADEVRLVVVKTGGKLPKVIEAHRIPVRYASDEERNETFAAGIAEAASRVKSNPPLYLWCAQSGYSIARQLTVPFKGARRVASAVQYELEPYLAFPIDDLVVRHLPIREVDGETQVLCVGIRRDYLEDNIALLEEGGVRAEGIALDALGLTHLWNAHGAPNAGLNAALHVRNDHAILCIKSDKRLAYVRHMSTPAARFHENPQSAARDVQKILRAFVSGWSTDAEIESFTVTGLRLYEDERTLFTDCFDTPVAFLDLAEGVIDVDESDMDLATGEILGEVIEHRWAACIGAAAGAAGAPSALDFQTGDLGAAPSRSGIVRHVAFTAVLALIALAGYITFAFMDYRANQAEVGRIGHLVWEEYQAAYPNETSGKDRPQNDVGGLLSFQKMTEAAEAESQSTSAMRVEFFSKPTLLDVLRELASRMPDEKVGINELKLALSNALQIELEGEVKDTTAFSGLVDELGQSDLIGIVGNPDRSSARGKETFSLKAEN